MGIVKEYANRRSSWTFAVACQLLLGCSGSGRSTRSQSMAVTEFTLRELTAKVVGGTVGVLARTKQRSTGVERIALIGSGVVVARGRVATCNHVVQRPSDLDADTELTLLVYRDDMAMTEQGSRPVAASV